MSIFVLSFNISKALSQLSPGSRKLLTSQGKYSFPVSRWICGKNFRDPEAKRAPPFPYKEKKYTMVKSWFDRTTERFDENSKIIVVDGAVAAGKSAFAKALAEDLDMFYMPEADMDMIYINQFGYDMRQLDPQLPEDLKTYDKRNFCLNPNHRNAAFLQCMLYQLKYSHYIDALAHVMNTGQGVVMEKSPYSDFVYLEAMVREGFVSKNAKNYYYEVKRTTIDELMKPHLAIYLDMSVEKIQQKIKERNRPHEQNSKALSTSFLTALEDGYKRKYLKEASVHSEILIYDWSDGGDVEVVVEDIERIDFDKYTIYDEKMKDWRLPSEQAWSDERMLYTDQKGDLMNNFNVPRLNAPELWASGEDMEVWQRVWWGAPGMKYEKGFYAAEGDKNVLWKCFRKTKWHYN